MAEENVIAIIKNYLAALPKYGIHATKAVLFGSFVTGKTHEWSDIDVVVIAPEYDSQHDIELVKILWLATVYTDDRIEPIHCGELEWETDDFRPILDVARREGIVISL